MKTSKNIKGLSLVILSLSLFGCGTSITDNSSISLSSNDSSMSLDDGDISRDANGNIIYNQVNLKMWSVATGDDASTQDEIINEFNTMYDGMIHVETTHISRYDLETQLQSTLQFDVENAPDLLFNHSSRTAEYINRDWLQSFEPIYSLAGINLDKTDFVPSLLSACTIDNSVYTIPIDCHSTIIEVRKDILDKNDLSMPNNYSELCALQDQVYDLAKAGNFYIRGENSQGIGTETWRKAAVNDDYHIFPISYGDMWVHEFFGYTAAAENGGDFVAENGKPAWNTENAAAGLQLLRDWIFPSETSANKHALSEDYGSDYDVGITPFRSGDCIFKLNGPWSYDEDLTTFDRDFKNDGGSLTNIATTSLSGFLAKVTSNSDAKKIKGEGHAVMLLKNATSRTKCAAGAVFADYLAYYSGITWAKRGHLPALKSVASSSEYLNDESYTRYIKDWGDASDYVVIQPTRYYSYVDTYFKNAVLKSVSSQFLSQNVSSILDKEYTDCVNYIDLYE